MNPIIANIDVTKQFLEIANVIKETPTELLDDMNAAVESFITAKIDAEMARNEADLLQNQATALMNQAAEEVNRVAADREEINKASTALSVAQREARERGREREAQLAGIAESLDIREGQVTLREENVAQRENDANTLMKQAQDLKEEYEDKLAKLRGLAS